MAGITELEKAALMLSVATDTILKLTDAHEISSTSYFNDAGERVHKPYVHVLDDQVFDRLAEGQELQRTKLESQPDGEWEKLSFELCGVEFINLRHTKKVAAAW